MITMAAIEYLSKIYVNKLFRYLVRFLHFWRVHYDFSPADVNRLLIYPKGEMYAPEEVLVASQ
jgi:hypothetical protein